MKKILSFLLALLLLPAVCLADLEARFLDVGQGDCAVVICDGEAMVIDGGPRGASANLSACLRNTPELRKVKYVVSTHPHVDHVYGLAAVLNTVRADLLMTPVTRWDSKAFNSMLTAAKRQGTPVLVPDEGDEFALGGATVTILHCWPEALSYGRTNDSSIVLRIDYGSTSFLFTGDAEDWSEYMMLDAGVNLKADVLKVAHHGSRTATTLEFLRKVQPEYAVISVGKDNSYGHPHREVTDNLRAVGAQILRTDQDGTIVLRSDGKNISVMTGSGK